MTIRELRRKQAVNIRRKDWEWYNYISFDVLADGSYGPFAHLHNLIGTYDSPNMDNVQNFLLPEIDDKTDEWELYNETLHRRPIAPH